MLVVDSVSMNRTLGPCYDYKQDRLKLYLLLIVSVSSFSGPAVRGGDSAILLRPLLLRAIDSL